MVNYWKSKVLPKIKKVFENPKKTAAAEACKSFDESKEEYSKTFEDNKTELQPKVVEIYEASSVEIKTLVKDPKESGLKKHSAAVQKFLDELTKIATKSNIFPSLNSLIKRSGKLASTALGKVLQHNYQVYYSKNLTCRSEDVHLSFVSPGDYEFSCSNCPAYPAFYHISKQRNRGSERGHHRPQIELLYHGVVRASPLIRLPGYGHSPEVRQLRVTDSPFSVKDMEEDYQVDIDAEEFIKRFYKDLESQRRL